MKETERERKERKKKKKENFYTPARTLHNIKGSCLCLDPVQSFQSREAIEFDNCRSDIRVSVSTPRPTQTSSCPGPARVLVVSVAL